MKLGEIILGGLGLLALGAIAAKLMAKEAKAEEPETEPESPKAPGRPPPGPAPKQSHNVYRTPLERVKLAPFVPLPSGGSVSVEPALDTETGLYARLSYADAASLAASVGGRLLTMPQVFEVWRIGYRLKPCTLVHSQADFALMQSIEYARKHDECVRSQLQQWDRRKPLANAGKDWIADASPGRARNGGWVLSEGKAIQPGGPGSEHHDRDYTDYSQLTRVWKP